MVIGCESLLVEFWLSYCFNQISFAPEIETKTTPLNQLLST